MNMIDLKTLGLFLAKPKLAPSVLFPSLDGAGQSSIVYFCCQHPNEVINRNIQSNASTAIVNYFSNGL